MISVVTVSCNKRLEAPVTRTGALTVTYFSATPAVVATEVVTEVTKSSEVSVEGHASETSDNVADTVTFKPGTTGVMSGGGGGGEAAQSSLAHA